MSETTHLPSVNRIGLAQPLDWLAGGLADFLKIPGPSLTLIGIMTFFLGLVIIFPVIGFASWRAYRDLVAR